MELGKGFDQVIEAMVDVVLVVDVAGNIQLANSAAAEATGHTPQELAKLPIADLLVDEHSGIRTAVRARVSGGDVLRRVDSWLVAKTGKRTPVSVTAAPLAELDGTVSAIVIVARDISELHEALTRRDAEIAGREAAEVELRKALASIEERLEQSRAQLLFAERLATLGTLAGGVGHELRNIAQIQVLAIDAILSQLDNLDEEGRAAMTDLERSGQHVALHARRLLELARPGPDHTGPVNLNVVIRDVIGMLAGAGKLRNIESVLALDEQGVFVTVNKTRIEQILVNLVINAADALGRAGGKIAITAYADKHDRVIVEVSDTGPGIPADVLPRIFDAFFTTKASEGTGLGLPVVKEIVESYGGKLTVSSTVGVGTTFTFDLPLSK
jgi:PAS domain S-box-containing protein